jgi:hypothetical protein
METIDDERERIVQRHHPWPDWTDEWELEPVHIVGDPWPLAVRVSRYRRRVGSDEQVFVGGMMFSRGEKRGG